MHVAAPTLGQTSSAKNRSAGAAQAGPAYGAGDGFSGPAKLVPQRLARTARAGMSRARDMRWTSPNTTGPRRPLLIELGCHRGTPDQGFSAAPAGPADWT